MIPPGWSYRRWLSLPDDYYGEPDPGDDVLLADQWDGLAHIDPRARMYLQDLGLFVRASDEIRLCFTPSEAALAKLGGEQRAWIFTHDPIALHVRRGDTVTQPAGFQPLAPLTYYRNALSAFPGDRAVIVFSDDPRWCMLHLSDLLGDRHRLFVDHGAGRSHKPNVYRRQPAMDWVDLQLMAKCSSHIISNSTYAWWGAWLSGNPIPIYPEVWWGENLSYIDSDLMIPEGWVEVPCA